MKATAVAHPIQGIVKYHGFKNFKRRIPFHNSISVCTAPTSSTTTVELDDDLRFDEVRIDGLHQDGQSLERCLAVLGAVRAATKMPDAKFRVESRNNFPKYVGLGSSSSGFAALAAAAFAATGAKPRGPVIGEAARMGAGSATRSVSGGFSEWVTTPKGSYGVQLAGPKDLAWATWAVVVMHDVPTELAHRDFGNSPYLHGRLRFVAKQLELARKFIKEGDAEGLMEVAEADTLSLHGATMAAPSGLVAWRGVTVEVIHRVREMRERGVPAWFSIDTGATVYVNSLPEHAGEVEKWLEPLCVGQGSPDLLRLEPAPGVRLVDEHLF